MAKQNLPKIWKVKIQHHAAPLAYKSTCSVHTLKPRPMGDELDEMVYSSAQFNSGQGPCKDDQRIEMCYLATCSEMLKMNRLQPSMLWPEHSNL